MSVAEEIDWATVEIVKGRIIDEMGDRWFVVPTEADGSQIIMSDHRSYAAAMVEALSYGLPVVSDQA